MAPDWDAKELQVRQRANRHHQIGQSGADGPDPPPVLNALGRFVLQREFRGIGCNRDPPRPCHLASTGAEIQSVKLIPGAFEPLSNEVNQIRGVGIISRRRAAR
jgi:hypothetical protein